MTEGIIIGIITAASAVVCQIIISISSNSKARQAQQESQRLIEYKIGELNKQVVKHNNLIERQYNIEKITAVLSEEIKVANHRISDLESEVKHNEK